MLEKKRKKVALIMGYYAHRLHKGAVQYAVENNWILDASMAITGKIPKDWKGDGVLSYHHERDDIIEVLNQLDLPTVDLGHPSEKIVLPTVQHDNLAIGKMAAEHLLAQGFRDLAYFWWWGGKNDQERSRGLKEEVFASGARYYDIQRQSLEEDIVKLPRPIAIMAQNDYIALELMNSLLELGFKVPEELAVIGADDDELFTRVAPVPLTSVDTSLQDCAYVAAGVLDELMEGQPRSLEPLLIEPKEVVARTSTDILAVPHKPCAKALKYIRDHFCEELDLEAISVDSGMCRRRLEDAFKKYFDRSMSAEIRRLRLEKAKKLLVESDWKVNVIAEKCGFSNGAHFCRVFKKGYSISPNDFRLNSLKKKGFEK